MPRGRLEPPEAIKRQVVPAIEEVDPPAARPGFEVVIYGEGLWDPGLPGPLVTLSGEPMEVVASDSRSVRVRVPVFGDGFGEFDETFELTISEATLNAAISDGRGEGTIRKGDWQKLLHDNKTDEKQGHAT